MRAGSLPRSWPLAPSTSCPKGSTSAPWTRCSPAGSISSASGSAPGAARSTTRSTAACTRRGCRSCTRSGASRCATATRERAAAWPTRRRRPSGWSRRPARPGRCATLLAPLVRRARAARHRVACAAAARRCACSTARRRRSCGSCSRSRAGRERPAASRAAPAPARRRRARLRQGAARGCAATLEDELGLVAATEPLHDEAVARAGGAPGGRLVEARRRAATPTQRADARRRRAARAACWRRSRRTCPGTLADVDSEFLHDLRVAVRRTRSLQRELRRRVPARAARRTSAPSSAGCSRSPAPRATSTSTCSSSTARAALPEAQRATSSRCAALLAEHRARERAAGWCGRCARRARQPLLADWAAFVDGLRRCPDDDRPRRARGRSPPWPASGSRAVYRRMVAAWARRSTRPTPAEALHDLRKKGKELRYLLEFFAALFPDDVVKPMVKTLKALQDTLGRFQDREVQAGDAARARRRGRARATTARPALMAMGVLVERLERRPGRARAPSSPSASPRSPRKPQRALVRETFAMSTRPRHLQHQGRRREDVGRGQPRLPRRARAARARCSGTSTRRARAPTCSGSSRRSRAAARKLVRGKSDVDALIKGTDYERLDLLPADFSYRHMDLALDATKNPTRRLARAARPARRPTTTTCSSTARRASRWSPRACSRPPTRCSSR